MEKLHLESRLGFFLPKKKKKKKRIFLVIRKILYQLAHGSITRGDGMKLRMGQGKKWLSGNI